MCSFRPLARFTAPCVCTAGPSRDSHDDVKNHVIVLPPPAEQDALVARIESETASLDSGIKSVQREIALYREFHDRLVAEVVTGKLDVRAAAAALPEITESEPIDEPIDGEDFEEALDDIEDEVVVA
jgi:type I restriction enzyme, S subunit